MNRKNNIVLLGFMGTGKSTVGRLLAEKLQYSFVDLDAMIEEQAGCSITSIFEREREAGFRKREHDAVIAAASLRQHVIATGGGVVLNPDNLRILGSSGHLVCLTATPETILARVSVNSDRPLLQTVDPLARIRELLTQRLPLYEAIPICIATDSLTTEEICNLIIDSLTNAGSTRNPGEGICAVNATL